MTTTPTTRNQSSTMKPRRTRHHPSMKHEKTQQLESEVEFESVLRIRPLQKKEKDDHVVLESATSNKKSSSALGNSSIAVLHPMMHSMMSPDTSSVRRSFSPNFLQNGEEQTFHFDKIYDPSATQDTLHYALGLSMASHAMDPLKKGNSSGTQQVKNHLVLSMGVAGGGKSYTVFGPTKSLGRAGKHTDDGLVPRILESLFAQSKHHVSSKSSFAIRMIVLHVEGDKVFDLLADTETNGTPSDAGKKRSGAVKAMVATFEHGRSDLKDDVAIDQDPQTHDYHADACAKTCWNATEARESLHGALGRAQTTTSRFAGFGKAPVRGHTLVTVQPVLIQGRRRNSSAIDLCGGTIAVLDMAGIERTKKGRGGGASKHDSVAINSSNAAVMHVLRTLKHNNDVRAGKEPLDVFRGSDDDNSSDGSDLSNVSEHKVSQQSSLKFVPYRQSKVTMLMQPLFSKTGEWNSFVTMGKTLVTTILAAYPGHRDYAEKQSLLNDIEMLFGVDTAQSTSHRVHTGVTTREDHKASKTKLRAHNKTPSPFTSSAPDDSYDLDCAPIDVNAGMPLSPIPPPFNPHAPSTPAASAPLADDLDLEASRDVVHDFPGVALPVKPSVHQDPATPHGALQSHDKESMRSKKKDRSPHPSKHASPALALSSAATPLRAKVKESPNIRPPSTMRSVKEDSKSPNRSLMANSPLKSISRAIHASKKTGKRASEQTVDGSLHDRFSCEADENTNASKENLLRRIKGLEAQNERLLARSETLEDKCEQLKREKDKLKRSLREATQRLRQSWTENDEHEWQRSKRLRVEEQRLIESPLEHHIAHVQATHEISSDWVHGGKPPFALQFPRSWTPAQVLNDRDHEEDPVTDN